VIASILIGLAIALVASLAAMVALVFAVRSPGQSLAEVVWLLPESLRLTAALYRDRTLPSSVRWRLRIAVVYNIQPINLIPNVVPVLGFADNVAVLAWALRATLRISGHDTVARHWTGTPESLATLYRALRVPPAC
jgi:uncharacterized membrane protein YkvA (DUF1232 family)